MNIVERVKKIAIKLAQEMSLDIIDVEWVNENGNDILRIVCDSKEGLTIDESALFNESIGNILDDEDFIKEEYYIEVCSPGIERELKTDEDITRNIGKYIHVELKQKIDINKKIKVESLEGYLKEFENNILEIEYNNIGQMKLIKINKDQIKIVRLAIKF